MAVGFVDGGEVVYVYGVDILEECDEVCQVVGVGSVAFGAEVEGGVSTGVGGQVVLCVVYVG